MLTINENFINQTIVILKTILNNSNFKFTSKIYIVPKLQQSSLRVEKRKNISPCGRFAIVSFDHCVAF